MVEICPIEECTGCRACENICSHKAIQFRSDKIGFYYPHINQEICVNCGLCARICPNNTPPQYNKPLKALVSCAKNSEIQLNSTSGGLATVISATFIRGGGIVYACSGKNPLHVKHIRINNLSDLSDAVGSKYVQSDMSMICSAVLKDIKMGCDVLFIGTPCQVAGIKNFIGKNREEHLYTIDFVCHGVPSQKILNDALYQSLDGHIPNNLHLKFRIKERKGFFGYKNTKFCKLLDTSDNETVQYRTRYGLFGFSDNRAIIYETFPKSSYITGFLTGLFYRECCYSCHYAQLNRVSDMSLGDYHFTGNPNSHNIDGVNRLLSKCIINTEKGTNLINSCDNQLNSMEIPIKTLAKGHGQLSKPMNKNPHREQFVNAYVQNGFAVTDSILRECKLRIRLNLFINCCRDFLYNIPLLNYCFQKLKND